MKVKYVICLGRSALVAALFVVCSAPLVRAQGTAPETAAPLFPGGALISYNSIFNTRGLAPGDSLEHLRHGQAHVLARRRFQFHLGILPRFRPHRSHSRGHKSL